MELLLTSISELLGDMKMNVFKEKIENVIAFPSDTSVADFIEEYTKWNEKNYFKKRDYLSLQWETGTYKDIYRLC